jgi:pimeloyl-ACP methyl ester carboxylesterase
MFAILSCPLLLITLSAEPQPKDSKTSPIVGLWEGALKVGAVNLRLAFKIAELPDKGLSATMDSIDQGAKGIPVDKVTLADNKLTLELPKLKATFSGTVAADLNSVKGEWKQADTAFPLEIKRVEKISEVRRPQTPQPPFPYVAEEVTFENKTAALKLAGTLTKPKGDGPFPAVILITGSGPQDRDETLFNHKPFMVLADHLSRKGIAVLRYDDRGVGKSTGEFIKATTADFATDVQAAIAFLKERKEIDAKKIGLMGHSEGGLIAPIVAAQNPEVAFIVLLAGPGVSGEEILIMQGQALLKAMKADEKTFAFQKKIQEKLFKLIREGADAKAIEAALQDALKEIPEKTKKAAEAQLKASEKMLGTVWMRYFLTYDPRNDLKKVRCPVLAVNGEKDLQVPPAENLSEIEKALKGAGNKDVTIQEFKGLNHLFQTCQTGLLDEYGKIEETFAPAALDVITEWILKRAK